jgi:hypothetical protein
MPGPKSEAGLRSLPSSLITFCLRVTGLSENSVTLSRSPAVMPTSMPCNSFPSAENPFSCSSVPHPRYLRRHRIQRKRAQQVAPHPLLHLRQRPRGAVDPVDGEPFSETAEFVA